MPRLIALYLPQFHPTDGNNKWYGKGFTEWTNVCAARPLFFGHYQPHIPADLGFYDLRLRETRLEQAALAKKYGIEGFCYYYYRFNSEHHELDLPYKLMLESGEPDFPFMVCWANESWQKKMWNKDGSLGDSKILALQEYLGDQDYKNFFYEMLPAFKDKRYIKIDNKPAFMIYKHFNFPDVKEFISLWNDLAIENGFDGIYFIGHTIRIEIEKEDLFDIGLNGIQINGLREYWRRRSFLKKAVSKLLRYVFNYPLISPYKKASQYFVLAATKENDIFPTIIPNWDHTPRSGRRGNLLTNSTPKLFRKHLECVRDVIKNKPADKQIAFIMAWNEWGEGNHMEPDRKYGTQYLEQLRDVFKE